MEKIDEIALAQQIVRNAFINILGKEPFEQYSGIYRFTNEDITNYQHHLKDKRKILSVIGGGQQILNSILLGTREIDCFDISIFPEKYLFLQLASIKALSKSEYLEYYFSEDREVIFGDDLYDQIREYLPEKYKTFWDHLYMFDEGYDIYNSLLFRSDVCIKNHVIDTNTYLEDSNYERLRNILLNEEIIINPYVGDIRKLEFKDRYDLINLSNIMEYICSSSDFKSYIEFLKNNFNLSENGEILNYIFSLKETHEQGIKEALNDQGYIEDINGKKLVIYKGRNK